MLPDWYNKAMKILPLISKGFRIALYLTLMFILTVDAFQPDFSAEHAHRLDWWILFLLADMWFYGPSSLLNSLEKGESKD